MTVLLNVVNELETIEITAEDLKVSFLHVCYNLLEVVKYITLFTIGLGCLRGCGVCLLILEVVTYSVYVQGMLI